MYCYDFLINGDSLKDILKINIVKGKDPKEMRFCPLIKQLKNCFADGSECSIHRNQYVFAAVILPSNLHL